MRWTLGGLLAVLRVQALDIGRDEAMRAAFVELASGSVVLTSPHPLQEACLGR